MHTDTPDHFDRSLADPGEAVAEWTKEDAVARRRHRWWLRTRAAEAASVASVLWVAAEEGSEVVLGVRSTRRVRGRVTAVGDEAVVLATARGRSVVRSAAITSVRRTPDAAGPDPAGPREGLMASDSHRSDAGRPWHDHDDRSPATGSFREALAVRLVRPTPGTLYLVDGERHCGTVWSLGVDVVTVRERGHVVYVALDSVAEASLESG